MIMNNPYIHLITTKPELIIPFEDTESNDHALTLIQNKMANYSRVFCELGSGSGRFLLEHAKLNKNALFIGFEIRFKRIYRTAEKAEKINLSNILLLQTRAETLAQLFPENTLDGIYVNFPDPWEKPRWHKHRLLNATYLDNIHTCLKPGAFLSYKTDHQEYFDGVLSHIQSNAGFRITTLTYDLHTSEWNASNIKTEFELMFKSQKRPIYFLEAVKN
jgi:tRNA (guanine-N7-)-methyltransferase